jgi:HPt (histidine-containing phosphotransfer) domain-containing protein
MTARNVVRLDPDLADLITPYLATRRQHLEEMRAALTRGDWDTVSGLAHKTHGTAGSYGFHDLSRIGAEIEQACTVRDQLGARRGLAEFENYLATLVVSYAA